MVADVRGAGCANPRSRFLPQPLHRFKVSIDREEISFSHLRATRNIPISGQLLLLNATRVHVP
jgi:hypothetical protein